MRLVVLKVDAERNEVFFGAEKLPAHILDLAKKAEAEAEAKAEELKEAMSKMTLTVRYNGKVSAPVCGDMLYCFSHQHLC
jgi:hypothetical protein